jgi:hypothetical protein
MKKNLQYFKFIVIVMLALSFGHNTRAQNVLAAPEWSPSSDPVYGTNIPLRFANVNEDSQTEIYRSFTANDGYQLIHTAPPGSEFYLDSHLKPRTLFYYKLRAIRGTEASYFSDVQWYKTYSQFFYPEFTATALSAVTVELLLHDLSYADLNYDIERKEEGNPAVVHVWQLEAIDSGEVHTFIDDSVLPNKKYTYSISVLVHDEGNPSYFDIVTATVQTPPLSPPQFAPPPAPYYENNILFGISNRLFDSETEIYRSLSPDKNFVLIASIPSTEIAYYDADLRPRTKHYYKLRTSSLGFFSEYTGPKEFLTGSKYYNPTLTGTALSPTKIELKLHDLTYDDRYYDIIRYEGSGIWSTVVVASDSGRIISIIDSLVYPGTTNKYRVDAYTKGYGNPNYQGVAMASVTTPEIIFLEPPTFLVDPQACESTINFEFYNPDGESSTEIYRSLHPDNDFVLIETFSAGNEGQITDDVNSNTTYFYKLRAVKGEITSEFSETREVTSLYDFHHPELVASSPNAETVELLLTDQSYADLSYSVRRLEVGSDHWEDIESGIEMLDSGQTYFIGDYSVQPYQTYTYYIDAIINCDGSPVYYEVASATVTVQGEIFIPMFGTAYEYTCGNELAFMATNYGDDLNEIYRSASPDGPFELIATQPNGSYIDRNLGSRKTYYYKLRAVNQYDTSGFSSVKAYTAGPAFFKPLITATLLEDYSVQITFQDRSYLDYQYEITSNGLFVEGVFDLDSGATYMLTDVTVIPGNTYVYSVRVELFCEGLPIHENVASDTIYIPDAPAITSFFLVDPYTDLETSELSDLYRTIDLAYYPETNIRVSTNNKVGSVVFYLNGKRYGENQEPYALFGDWKGDYRPGKLKPGFYTLTATAYSGNNQQGIRGNTLTRFLTVIDSNDDKASGRQESCGFEVNLFPNPVVNTSLLELVGKSESMVSMAIIDSHGNILHKMYNVPIHEGLFQKEISAKHFKSGEYILVIKIKDKMLTKRFVVEASTE